VSSGFGLQFRTREAVCRHSELARESLSALLPLRARGRRRVMDRASARSAWPAPQASLTRVTARR
jgi:hypothetical protein